MDAERKKKLYKQIDNKTRVISHPTSVHETVDFIERGFPKQMFDEWKSDCYARFNDIYWAKLWSDHLKAQAYDNLVNSAVSQQSEKEEKIDENENIPLIGDPKGVGGNENG